MLVLFFSGDNFRLLCQPQKKIYKHIFRRRDESCQYFTEKEIVGYTKSFIWSTPPWSGYDYPQLMFDYISYGIPRDRYHWLGFGLYHIFLKNDNLPSESDYSFYIDFTESTWRDPVIDLGTDILIEYDFLKPINNRVTIDTFPEAKLTVENGKVYRIWQELKRLPNQIRNSDFYFPSTIPLDGITSDTLFAPVIIDINTNIVGYIEPDSTIRKIIIDPSYYPEPSKLTDLKLTILDNITLTVQNRAALIIGAGAEIALGNNSIIKCNSGSNLSIHSNLKWSFGNNSKIIVNGNFELKSPINSSYNLINIPININPTPASQIYPNATSPVFGYENGRYITKSTVKPGEGYWVKMQSDCNLLCNIAPPLQGPGNEDPIIADVLRNSDRFILSDAEGNTQELYIYTGGGNLEGIDLELPPAPPEGAIFDVRFATDRIIEI